MRSALARTHPRLLTVAYWVMGAMSCPGEEVPIAFNRDIKPILAENCYFCHGPDEGERKAGLRLDQFEAATATRDGVRAIVPGDPEASALVFRIFSPDPDERMPPRETKLALTDTQRNFLRQWVVEGAEYEEHWAFVPPKKEALPPGNSYHPIDRLMGVELEGKGLWKAPQAPKHTLIRRVSLDLTGLPPTPAELAAFLQDGSPLAYERVVDRLLNSSAFGERMAWDWLDGARYADSNGYQGDRERTMWPWRDWVVQAFNANLPFDQFTVYQLAGDLLPEANLEQKLATGFFRNHAINGEGGRIPEENRVDYVMDMMETMGTLWLGLTLNCCRCHDHKFDPITQREYYQLTAFFNQTPVDGSGGDPQQAPNVSVPTAGQKKALSVMEDAITRAEAAREEGESGAGSAAEGADIEGKLKALRERAQKLRDEIPKVMVMEDMGERRATYMLERGLYNQPKDEVQAGVPSHLHEMDASLPNNRAGLAKWLVDRENPLTARVTVNRFWQSLFGIGLVKTPEDFGTQGELPPQRALLDWLAVEFQESGWDVKALLRLIVTSDVYKQSSKATIGADGVSNYERDPDNRWLARGPRFRMPSWILRDQALAASGLLVRKVGGRAVNPYQPESVWEEASFGNKKYTQDHGEGLYRRSLYTFWRRIIAPPMFFDNASRQVCTVKPFRTNTPLHALLTFNDVTFVEAARVLAERVLQEDWAADDQARLDRVFTRLLSRPAGPEEAAILLARLDHSRKRFANSPQEAEAFLSIGEAGRDRRLESSEHAAWASLCLAVLNLDETLTKE